MLCRNYVAYEFISKYWDYGNLNEKIGKKNLKTFNYFNINYSVIKSNFQLLLLENYYLY